MTELLFRSHPYLTQVSAVVTGHTPEGGLLFDRSIFYPTGGGQPGDSGVLEWGGGVIPVATTIKASGDQVALLPAEPAALPPIGAAVEQRLDWERRYRHMRIHTALHLLSVAIPLPVTGGQIGTTKGRLDFDMPEPPSDIFEIEENMNRLIDLDLPVTEDWISQAELLANLSLIKTRSVMPPVGQGTIRLIRIGFGVDQVDLQPCGGTHVARTAEVGRIEIGKIENKGRQNRRVGISLVE